MYRRTGNAGLALLPTLLGSAFGRPPRRPSGTRLF
jgi:hypothetical protein